MFLLTIFCTLLTFFLLLTYPTLSHRLKLYFASLRNPHTSTPPTHPSWDHLFNTDLILQDLRLRKAKQRTKTWVTTFNSLKTKTYVFYPFGARTITTCDPRVVQFFVALEAHKFGNAGVRKPTVGMIGRGIMNSDGEEWERRRKWVGPTFKRARIADRVFWERHFERFLARVNAGVGDGEGVVDLKVLFDELVLDAASEFIFGESFESQLDDGRSVEGRRILKAFTEAQFVVGMRTVLGERAAGFVPDPRTKKFEENRRVFRDFTMRQVKEARRRQKEKKSNGVEEEDEENRKKPYILVDEMAKEIDDDEILCDELLNVFFAGRDAPAVALSNVFFSLVRHPNVWKRMREETEGLKPEDMTFETLKGLRYVQFVINEGLRLFPALPIVSRQCLAETTLPYGGGADGSFPVTVIPGDILMFNIFALHRNADIFGPDVEVFRPERFEHIRPGWSFIPWSGGAHHCPAHQLALFWLSYTIVRMVREFTDVVNMDTSEEYREVLKLNMEHENGIKVKLIR